MKDRIVYAEDARSIAYWCSFKVTITLAKMQQKLKQLREFIVTFPSIKIYGRSFNSSGVLIRADGQTVEHV